MPAAAAAALQVAELYLGRWRIGKAFHHITLAYNCEIKLLCDPRAALFGFAMALVAYNAVSIVNATIAIEHSREDAAIQTARPRFNCETPGRTQTDLMLKAPVWRLQKSPNSHEFGDPEFKR